MKAEVASNMDCNWYITNLVDPSTDPSYNETLCEKYFLETRLEVPESINESYLHVKEVVHNLSDAPKHDLTLAEQVETTLRTTEWYEPSTLLGELLEIDGGRVTEEKIYSTSATETTEGFDTSTLFTEIFGTEGGPKTAEEFISITATETTEESNTSTYFTELFGTEGGPNTAVEFLSSTAEYIPETTEGYSTSTFSYEIFETEGGQQVAEEYFSTTETSEGFSTSTLFTEILETERSQQVAEKYLSTTGTTEVFDTSTYLSEIFEAGQESTEEYSTTSGISHVVDEVSSYVSSENFEIEQTTTEPSTIINLLDFDISETETTLKTILEETTPMPEFSTSYDTLIDLSIDHTTFTPETIADGSIASADTSTILETLLDFDSEQTTTKIISEMTTFSSEYETQLSTESAEYNRTLVEEIIEEIKVNRSTFLSASTGGYLDQLNESPTRSPAEEMAWSVINATDVLSKPDIISVNKSLCEWYIPTIEQTPHALGNVGIALWVLGFVITFILIILFAKQAFFIYKTSHKMFRRHLFSITSIYVVMAFLTSIGSGIPRAHAVCSGIKDVYMAIGIGHFVDLTITMYGGENVMAWYLKDKYINLRAVPICKCFFCIPRCKTKKISVTILKWIVWQMKWSQAVYYLLKLIWVKALENTLGVSPGLSASSWYLHILNVISFLSGVISLVLISSLVTDDLQEKYNYNIKAKLVRFTILVTKLQRLLFEILEACNVFPCYPPFVSQKYYKNVLKDFIYLVEVFILGVATFFVYNKRGEFEHANSSEVPKPMIEKEAELPGENGDVEGEVSIPLRTKSNDMPESNC